MEKEPLRDIFIPPMPEAVLAVRQELARPEPDMDRVAANISSDVTLATEVLRVVNSPGFGRTHKISSVTGAIMMLGLNNVVNITNGLALRAALEQGCRRPLDRFWDSAADVALASAALAVDLTGLPQDMAYTLGLIHDCGIAVMMCQDEAYADFMAKAQRSLAAADLIDAERAHSGRDHAGLGANVSEAWFMPEPITEAVRHHHHFADLIAADRPMVEESVLTLIGVLKMAEHVSHVFRGLAFRDLESDREWEQVGDLVLAYFELGRDEFDDRLQDLLESLGRR